MPKRIVPLSELEVKNSHAVEKTKTLFDGNGLFLEISPIGSKLWRLRYYFEGKQKLLSMGSYPEVSLKEARNRREEARKLIAHGIDPFEHRQSLKRAKEERACNSFEAVGREWFAKFQSTWVTSHAEKIIRRLERDIFPWLGGRSIAEIEAPELLRVFRRIVDRGAVETAHRAKVNCGQIFRYAVQTGKAIRDCTQDLKGAIPPSKEKHHAAIIESDKFGDLLQAIDGYRGGLVVKCALKLAPLLVVRPGELRKMEWVAVNLKTQEWRFTVSKTKVLHLVPLARQAVEILRELQPLTGTMRYVFPNPRTPDGSRPISENAVLAAIRNLGFGKGEATGHGFRASFRTIGAEVLKFRSDLMEHQLAHAVRDPLGRAYNRTEFIDERREMMQRWADYLDQLKAGKDAMRLVSQPA